MGALGLSELEHRSDPEGSAQCAIDAAPCGVEAGEAGLEWAAELPGNFIHRSLLELVEHEGAPLALGQARECALDQLRGLLQQQRVVLGRLVSAVGRRGRQVLPPSPQPAAVAGSDAQADAIEPGAQGRATLEAVQASVHD